jgi:hypothetical protein
MIAGATPQLDFYWFCGGEPTHNLGFGPMQIWVLGIGDGSKCYNQPT